MSDAPLPRTGERGRPLRSHLALGREGVLAVLDGDPDQLVGRLAVAGDHLAHIDVLDRVVVRPGWVTPGEDLEGTVEAVWFRGPHTDYRIITTAGTLEMRRPGHPEWATGDGVSVSIKRWWPTR